MNTPMFDVTDYPIGGKMVVARATLSDDYKMMLEDGNEEAKRRVKSDLIHQLAEYMLENNLVEFTQMKNPIDFSTTIAVRAYLAPNDQVKLLRLAKKIL